MKPKNSIKYALALAGMFVLTNTGSAMAASSEMEQLKKTVEMLQSQLKSVQAQLDAQKNNSVSKSEIRDLRKEVLSSSNGATTDGLGYAFNDSVVHLAGYGSAGYADNDNAGERFSQAQFAPIFHYQYQDFFMLESELEFEIDPDGTTAVGMEYLTIDLVLNDYATLVAGKFLSPIGQFRQNLHPSWINKLPSAPPGFGHDGAAPVADIGLQLRGGFPVGGVRTNYAVYVGNGPEMNAATDGTVELEGILDGGFARDEDDGKVAGGRIGVLPIPDLEIGLSGATGRITVTQLDGNAVAGDDNRRYSVYGADFAWKRKGMGIRGEYVKSKIGDAAGSIAADGADWRTWYLQGSYLVPNTKWEGVVRYTDFNSPHAAEDQKQWALGVNYLFASNVIAKAAYEFNDGQSGAASNEDTALFQLAYGF